MRDARPDELPALLERVLAPGGPGGRAPAGQVAAFMEYMRASAVGWLARLGEPPEAADVAFALLPPGRTAIVLTSQPDDTSARAADPAAALRDLLAALAPRGLHYAQTLLEPEQPARRRVFESLGFWRLATLVYQERHVREPARVAAPTLDAQWAEFTEDARPRFAATIAATYVDSLDCPRLTGLRPIEDVIASHQATGVFDARLWQLVRLDGQDAGCLLLGPLAGGSMIELVYMGVAPPFRGRGVGTLLVHRALELSRLRAAHKLMVVVDEANLPARRLYHRFGFRPVTTREAYLYQWPR